MIRTTCKNILGIFASGISVRVLTRLTGQNIILPFYHAVCDEDLPHLKYSYNIRTVKQFTDDLEFFLRWFLPITCSDLESIVAGEKKINKPVMAISFDDGLREVYDVITPLLIKKGIPATIFINPAFVDNKVLFYKYKAGLIVDRLVQAKHPESLYEVINSRLGTDIRKKTQMMKMILGMSYEDQSRLDSIAELLELDFLTFLKIRKPYMTVDQIRDLQQQGFQIGSHSIDHPLYSRLNLDEQIRQTKDSLAWITDTFSLDYRYFAFPFTDYGVSGDFFRAVFYPGKPIADIAFGTAGLKKTIYPFYFQRIPVEDSGLRARFFIRGEYLYYMLKGVVAKNTG